MKFPHHGLYSGEFKEDLPWGRGVYHHLNGDVFEGEMKRGLYHSSDRGGMSTLTYANGDIYEGQFKEGRLTGKGTFWYNEGKRKGDVYEGDFFEDLRHGKVRKSSIKTRLFQLFKRIFTLCMKVILN